MAEVVASAHDADKSAHLAVAYALWHHVAVVKYKGLMYDKQGHLAVFFENNMLIDRFGFIKEVVL